MTFQQSKLGGGNETLSSLVLFFFKRLAFGILILLVIIFLSHFGLDMASGNAFQPAIVRAVQKTVAYVAQLAQGDLGLSMAGSITLVPIPVTDVVPYTFARSLGLLFASLLVATIFGVILGLWAAKRTHSGWSLVTILISIAGISVPSFFSALILQMGLIRLTQITGKPILPAGGFGWDEHIILPALVLAARPLAQITRVTFVTVKEILEQDYVRTARGKGLMPRMVLYRHVIRNAAISILTTVGLSLRFSLISLPVVEYFFSWQGLGFILLKAISLRDDNLTVALVLCLGVLFILVNILLELSYGLIDPRSRQAPEYIKRGDRAPLFEWVKPMFTDLWAWFAKRPVRNWLDRLKTVLTHLGETTASRDVTLVASAVQLTPEQNASFNDGRIGKRRAWLQGTLGNLPFVVGGVLVAGLLVVILFSNRLSPHSPYTTHGLSIVDGEFSVPPFEPDETYPWGTDVLGRDIMSLILAGAQQTLFLAALVVLARMVVGFTLGSLAGWLSGSWIDRFLLGLSEIIAAFPTLLLSMIFILALGIRQGMRPFVITLCFVGWGEIMQFVRGEVMNIRPQLFIEGAVALGQRSYRIIVKHVLPNLIPALISLVALEMGAVLMLLGELGFIGIFIGGGAFAELQMYQPPYHYSDVPEWGALLSNVRPYARSYPWTAIYPGLAFFISILGFNLLGEGVRRMIERVGVEITRLIVNRYTMAFITAVVLGFVWLRGSTGAIAYYQRQANAFDGQQSMTHIEVLTSPELDGRALGSQGLDSAGEYIAEQFKILDIQPAGEKLTYFQTRSRSFDALDAIPTLAFDDDGLPLVYHQDYVEYPGEYRNSGVANGPVRFVAMGDLTILGDWNQKIPALEELNYSDEILLVLDEKDLHYLEYLPRRGILVVAQNPVDLERRYSLSFLDPHYVLYGARHQMGQDTPTLWISEDVANRLLVDTGYSVSQLRNIDEELNRDEILEIPTSKTISMTVQGTTYEKVPVRHVIGHLPGFAGHPAAQLDNKLIVVLAQYDSPPLSPNGISYPAAADNASGVAMMLEVIRTMQETGYQPYKTFLFVAYSGEGLEGGAVYYPEVSKFLQTKYGFSTSLEVEAIVELRGLGSEEGDHMLLSGGSLRLMKLFETTARRMGVPVKRVSEQVDLSIVFEERSLGETGQEAPSVDLSWDGWEEISNTPLDTYGAISVENLEEAGRALSLALMTLGRETQY